MIIAPTHCFLYLRPKLQLNKNWWHQVQRMLSLGVVMSTATIVWQKNARL
jgi:hypothetical protein